MPDLPQDESTTQEPDIDKLKARMKTVWSAGDYDTWSQYLVPGAMAMLDRLESAHGVVLEGSQLLDVACGAGQLCVMAAERGAMATGIDLAAPSLEAGRRRAEAAGVDVQFDEGDAEELPYDDESCDVVTSVFGAMFGPRPELVAHELVRVCRNGGTIAMANWTERGFLGEMQKLIASYVPPPTTPPPVQWGDEQIARERFEQAASELGCQVQVQCAVQTFVFNYPFAPTEVVDFYREHFGRFQATFQAVEEERGELGVNQLRRDLAQLWASHNKGANAVTRVESEFLEVVVKRESAD